MKAASYLQTLVEGWEAGRRTADEVVRELRTTLAEEREIALAERPAGSMSGYAVDVPDPRNPEDAWVCLGYFDTLTDALDYAQATLGADDEGRIGVVSALPAEPELELLGGEA